MANIVPMGTAPEECAAMRKKFRKMKVPNTILWVSIGRILEGKGYLGTRIGVRAMLSFQFSPPRFLYVYEETKPPTKPKKTYRITITVPKAPRLLGERKPNNAKTAVKTRRFGSYL